MTDVVILVGHTGAANISAAFNPRILERGCRLADGYHHWALVDVNQVFRLSLHACAGSVSSKRLHVK